ncbi:MAG: hypothetical protein COB67_11615 [SAR324 cluster bacterium]|uniref:HTH tetR-type domain-containing protein n=1 Tax=SAR324 cluster bacterium TaxID=2024889 RepID=A0A2A4STK7_9DELT|nr:MAG: hypothetical protein COB67_11615 [SAR324 cluster bacterium]
MPPKSKFSQEDVVEAAIQVVRELGIEKLSARAIAKQLNSSTQPIYSYMKSMQEFGHKLSDYIEGVFFQYMATQYTGDLWLDQAIGYVFFAKREKNLFRFFFGIRGQETGMEVHPERVFEQLLEQLSDYEGFQGLSTDEIHTLRRLRWQCTHGLACLINSLRGDLLTDEEIISNLKNSTKIIVQGLRATRGEEP